jgi:hypothetical protein
MHGIYLFIFFGRRLDVPFFAVVTFGCGQVFDTRLPNQFLLALTCAA